MTDELPILGQSAPLPCPSGDGRPVEGSGRAVYLETYGCQMNQADSELLVSILRGSGFATVDRPEEADVILLNTCAVREHAEARVIGRASQLQGLRVQRPGLTLGILGCMAQRLAAELPRRAPFVDLVVGPDAYRRLPELLERTGEEAVLDVRLRRSEDYAGITPDRGTGPTAWVTIMRGCDRFCSFCIVPYVRGRERSVPPEELLSQVERAARAGAREVTLLGQTVNSYRHGPVSFARLLREVAAVPGVARIRFTSPHPAELDEETLQTMAEVPQLCPSLHLPVQSGSDAQLERMRRGYTAAEYRRLVRRAREVIPGIALTTDVVVGFCGESEEDYRETVALMEEVRFDAAFLFKYSEREGTHAQRHLTDDVPPEVKQRRLEAVIALQERISYERNQEYLGRTVEVLLEGPARSRTNGETAFFGRSPQGKTVVCDGPGSPGDLVPVRVSAASAHTLLGERVRG
ncbi:MAG: tRNA (N6-isopentenyl adenosine(37)-C2)-methylthiotransferase MiaB [Candidatus Latescibacterota bacterium]|jgi:tRNA-2-methylthio-N6-dimethylallyladenosine synthase